MSNTMRPIVLTPKVKYSLECLLPKSYSAEIATLDRLEAAKIAAEAHRRARGVLQDQIQPGMSLLEIAEIIESSTKILLGQGYNQGIGFPTGLSLNSCAAHDTPNPKSKPTLLSANDVLKVDFGTQVDGYIIDSAFTVTFNPEYENLLLAARESVYACLKIAGPDVPLDLIGETADEVIRSYELTIDGRTVPIRPVANLNGHTINRFKIHGGKYVPIVKRSGNRDRMEVGEFYAFETFATTGNGLVVEKGDCSHYMATNKKVNSRLEGVKTLQTYIQDKFNGLPFCKRYIGPEIKCADVYLKQLEKAGGVEGYPPLCDSPGSLVAQFEHTLFVKEGGIEVLSKGDDY
ncbi:methionyl aminopeptidase [Nematocida homosporus]|uniref:methionyl aminopeptidase n=1 Tax=Nematocida homosporus TaxID=1912981 RepID=UPI00221FA6D3|nr:methionyl aminopeptidase [Nematocida homosporus]KAI5186361.1 methionyl aminopeptidase [Nematocida homosporus]